MKSVRITISMPPSTFERFERFANQNNEEMSSFIRRMVEAGLATERLMEERDQQVAECCQRLQRREQQIAELESRFAALQTEISQTSSILEKAKSQRQTFDAKVAAEAQRAADAEEETALANERADEAEARCVEAERERDNANARADAETATSPIVKALWRYILYVPEFRKTRHNWDYFTIIARGYVLAVLTIFWTLVLLPYDNPVSLGVAEMAMGKWGNRQKAAVKLHGDPPFGEATLLSTHLLLNAGKNARQITKCLHRASSRSADSDLMVQCFAKPPTADEETAYLTALVKQLRARGMIPAAELRSPRGDGKSARASSGRR